MVHTYFFVGEPDKDSLIAQNITIKLYSCVRPVSVNKPASEKTHETIRESHKIRCAEFNIIFLLKIFYWHLYSYLLLNIFLLLFHSYICRIICRYFLYLLFILSS